MFAIDEIVTTSKVDKNGRMKLFSAVQMMQDCSELWMESEPEYFACLEQEGRAQLVASRQVEILRVPDYRERLTVKTSIFDCKELNGFRNTIVYDSQGNVCYAGWSMGAFVDKASGKLRKLPKELMSMITYDEKFPMDYKERRIKVPSGPTVAEMDYSVNRNDIDYNHHVNNAQYLRLAMELVPETFEPQHLRIEYKIAVHMGDMVHVRMSEGNGGYYVMVEGERGVCAIMEFLP